jgi:putative DNA primase/helicase
LSREKSWWHNWPKANIGIATGNASNLIVIDLDERHGGVEAFRNWEKQHSAQTGLISKTGGGFHLFFAALGHQVKSRVGILPGVDVRAEGGFVVAPGSLHHSDLPYSWLSQETNDRSW